MLRELDRSAVGWLHCHVDDSGNPQTKQDAWDEPYRADDQGLDGNRPPHLHPGHRNDPEQAQLARLLEDIHRQRIDYAKRGHDKTQKNQPPQATRDAIADLLDPPPDVRLRVEQYIVFLGDNFELRLERQELGRFSPNDVAVDSFGLDGPLGSI